MSLSSLLLQFLTGLSSASSLFLVGAGLSLIFGVTRIVNFAHGSFFMVGIYVAYTLADKLGSGIGFWSSLVIASVAVGVTYDATAPSRDVASTSWFAGAANWGELTVKVNGVP